MAGVRPTKLDIVQGIEGWDAEVDDNFENLMVKATAIAEVANAAALLSADLYRNCVVTLEDYDGFGNPGMAWSDGVTWHLHPFKRLTYSLGSDGSTFDVIHTGIPFHDAVDLEFSIEQKGAGTPIPTLLLGDSTSFDTGTVYASSRWGCAGGAMFQSNSAADISLQIVPVGFTSLQLYSLSLRLRLSRQHTSPTLFVHGDWHIAKSDASAVGGGGSFRAGYGGSKTIDRVRLDLAGVNMDGAKAKARLRLL